MDILCTLEKENLYRWNDGETLSVVASLEQGKILFLPNLGFKLSNQENVILTNKLLNAGKKNISYNPLTQKLAGISKNKAADSYSTVKKVMRRFAEFAKQLILETAPMYEDYLELGRTSYRPSEIAGRKISVTKDDTLVHIDAFTATPVQGKRILRVFANINPFNQPRVWETGEAFSEVAERFLPKVKTYRPVKAKLMHLVGLTKTLRTEYDHVMLSIHDNMKNDAMYQNNLTKQQILFPPNSSWIVYTDQVSHAALSGQFLLEQTFYLPVAAMRQPEYAPWNQLKQVNL
jgi:hypothetical protein